LAEVFPAIWDGVCSDPARSWTVFNDTKGAVMYARTSTWTGSPEVLERWATHVNERVAPMVAGLPGNAGAYFFVDREGGSALTLTLWESEEAALASDQAAEKSRSSTVAATGIELLARGRFEVVGQV
jgi:heme-degrading monooxygenase HmoA